MSPESSNIDVDQAHFNNSCTENVDARSDTTSESRRNTEEQPDSAKELQDVKAERDLYEMKLKALTLVLASREAENKQLEVENKTLQEDVMVSNGRLEYAEEALETFFIVCANDPTATGMVQAAPLFRQLMGVRRLGSAL
jgi:primosomal protein N''